MKNSNDLHFGIAIGFAGTILIIGLWGVFATADGWQRSDFINILVAIGTIGATVGAFWGVRAARRTQEREWDRQERAIQDAKIERAGYCRRAVIGSVAEHNGHLSAAVSEFIGIVERRGLFYPGAHIRMRPAKRLCAHVVRSLRVDDFVSLKNELHDFSAETDRLARVFELHRKTQEQIWLSYENYLIDLGADEEMVSLEFAAHQMGGISIVLDAGILVCEALAHGAHGEFDGTLADMHRNAQIASGRITEFHDHVEMPG